MWSGLSVTCSQFLDKPKLNGRSIFLTFCRVWMLNSFLSRTKYPSPSKTFLRKSWFGFVWSCITFPQTHIMIPNSFCIFEPQRQHNDVVIFYTVLYCLWELRIFFIDTVGPFFQHQAAHFSSSFPMGHWDSHTLTVRRRHFQRSWGAMESLTTSTWRRRGWRGGWGSSLW